jgi:lactoylglutathione lyase
MLDIQNVNHIGIRISAKSNSVAFYELLGFELRGDAGFDDGHPIIMKHPGGVVLNLLGPASVTDGRNILMDVDDKYAGITHFALTVGSLDVAKEFMQENDISITGSFSFGEMSAIFIRDPDRNVIELDAYSRPDQGCEGDYSSHP